MRVLLAVVCALLLIPAVVFAFGGHEPLGCTGCHGIHTAKGDIIFAVEPNKTAVNPMTKAPYTGITALCLGCHETTGGMGILPVMGKSSHPYGVKPNPKVADVPTMLLRDDKLECVGCHDPHPSNPNHKYLRVNTDKGSNMADFCSVCHSSKSGAKVSASKLFDSMDEMNKSAVEKPAAPKPSPAPAAPKKQ